MGNMRLYLRANEKIFINGAVLRVDRKVSIELLNDATFLLENHVMQKEEADTPLKQLYFVVQMLLMDPSSTEQPTQIFKQMIGNLLETLETPELLEGVKSVDVDVSTGKPFAALKTIRQLFPTEESVMGLKPKAAAELIAAQSAKPAKIQIAEKA